MSVLFETVGVLLGASWIAYFLQASKSRNYSSISAKNHK